MKFLFEEKDWDEKLSVEVFTNYNTSHFISIRDLFENYRQTTSNRAIKEDAERLEGSECNMCEGSGVFVDRRRDGYPCTKCNGSGVVHSE